MKHISAHINDWQALTVAMGYQFRDPSLLLTALKHKSCSDIKVAGTHGHNNERLEFLGDAVLSVVAANYLYQENNFFSEGDLSRLRAQFVCQENLSEAAREIDLGHFIMGDRAMRASGSTNSKAVLADAMEAIIGAVFMDGGLEAAEQVVFKILGKPSLTLEPNSKDPKTRLQEVIQAKLHASPSYVTVEIKGPAHAQTFVMGVMVNNEVIAMGEGVNKKVAAQNAAIIALEKFNVPASSS